MIAVFSSCGDYSIKKTMQCFNMMFREWMAAQKVSFVESQNEFWIIKNSEITMTKNDSVINQL